MSRNRGTTLFAASAASANLRNVAEERLRAKRNKLDLTRPDEASQKHVHELEVHQIELEMQGEELAQARDDVETMLEKYTDLYDFAPVGFCNLDRSGVIGLVNLTAASLLGVERSRLLGQRFGTFVAGEQRRLFTGFLTKVFESRGNKETCELMLSKEGNADVFVRVEAFAGMSGQECRVAVIDISDRRRVEDALVEKRLELEELNRTLEVRIARTVDELRSKDQMLILQDRRAVMGEMINNIAHQWRQPLNLLGLHIQELPLYYSLGEFSQEYLDEKVQKSMVLIQQMSSTIDDFRSFFKPDKRTVTFGLNQVIASTVSMVAESYREQQITITFDSEGDPSANGYPNQYSQVLLNILMNARDALVEKSVVDGRILIQAFGEAGHSVVTISDNAGGVSEEIMDRIFDPYFTTRGPDKGTGIGLYMSKTIIEKSMGGRLSVKNNNDGAEFRIQV